MKRETQTPATAPIPATSQAGYTPIESVLWRPRNGGRGGSRSCSKASTDVVKNWQLVESLPYLIGDFIWTGWDHLGEAGLQGWAHGKGSAPSMKPYPYVLSGGGALDLIGMPTAIAFLSQVAWKLDRAPAIVVRPLDVVGQPYTRSPWRPTDAIAAGP